MNQDENVEDRLRRLEAFRYAALGTINAQTTIITDLWCNFIAKEPDPVAIMNRLKAGWLSDAENPTRSFSGVDPAHLDLVSQEYREAIERLADAMLRKLRAGPTIPREDTR